VELIEAVLQGFGKGSKATGKALAIDGLAEADRVALPCCCIVVGTGDVVFDGFVDLAFGWGKVNKGIFYLASGDRNGEMALLMIAAQKAAGMARDQDLSGAEKSSK